MKTAAFTKSYGNRTVLRLPALDLPEGMITAVIGANGSGKSTLARVLAGIEAADGNTTVLKDCSVGYLPQKSYAFRMSTRRNILLNGEDSARAEELMQALGLEDLARQRAGKLSGGETAKMTLCRLLMGTYRLLILDEPTAAMDMESTLAAEELIRKRCRETGCGVLLITHSIQQARRLASRAIFLHKGELAEQGDAERVLYLPQDPLTQRFLEVYGV